MSDTITSERIHIQGARKRKVQKATLNCPFMTVSGCRVNARIRCRYGLTEIKVPKDCPLHNGPVTTTVSLRGQS